MSRLDLQARRRIIVLRSQGHSVRDIASRLQEGVFVSLNALYKLFRKYNSYETYADLATAKSKFKEINSRNARNSGQ